jgi:hypothetical protein
MTLGQILLSNMRHKRERTDGRTDKGKSKCPPLKWGNTKTNQSTERAEFVWVSECKKGAGCEIICLVPPMLSSVLIVENWL